MQKFETLTKLKTSNNHLFIFTSTSTYLRFSIAPPSSFPHLPVHSLFVFYSSIVRLIFPLLHSLSLGEGWGEDILFVFSLSARAVRTVLCSFFIRSLFVLCSFFVRLLFVFCSSFVRLLFVFCSSFVRLLFVHYSFIVRSLFVHCSFIVRSLFVFPISFSQINH